MDVNHPWVAKRVAKRRRHGSKKTTQVIKVVLLLFNPYIHGKHIEVLCQVWLLLMHRNAF